MANILRRLSNLTYTSKTVIKFLFLKDSYFQICDAVLSGRCVLIPPANLICLSLGQTYLDGRGHQNQPTLKIENANFSEKMGSYIQLYDIPSTTFLLIAVRTSTRTHLLYSCFVSSFHPTKKHIILLITTYDNGNQVIMNTHQEKIVKKNTLICYKT